jgi:ABC-type glycerol-3-phosphate transport system substrate-binding protein
MFKTFIQTMKFAIFRLYLSMKSINNMLSRLMLLLVSVCIISCSGSDNNIDSEALKAISTVKVTTQLNFVGHWLDQAKREDLVKEMAKEYEFLNQNCSVNLIFPENIYYDRAKLNCEEEFVRDQILSEHPKYDIIRINDSYSGIAAYMNDPDWAKKYLVDFSQYPEFNKYVLPELINDSAKAKWKGIIPGPYLEGYNYAIWYNRALAKEIGITVKQSGMTFDDLLEYVKAIDAYNKSHGTNIIPIQECSDWTTINIIYLRLYMSELNDINECLKPYASEKKLAAFYKTLKALEELSKYNAYSKGWRDITFNNSLNYPLKRKSFFYVNASWMYNYWQKIDKKEVDNMVPNELPVFKTSDLYFGGYSVMWAVPKNAPHKEEAIKFLLFMNKPDIAEKWVRYTKCPSGIKGNMASVTFGTDRFEDFTYNIDKTYGTRKLSFNYLNNGMVAGATQRGLDLHAIEVATGLMTADEAMAIIKRNLRIER